MVWTQSLATIREALVGLLTTLLKAKQAREQVLQWVAAVANHNRCDLRHGVRWLHSCCYWRKDERVHGNRGTIPLVELRLSSTQHSDMYRYPVRKMEILVFLSFVLFWRLSLGGMCGAAAASSYCDLRCLISACLADAAADVIAVKPSLS